MIRSFETGAPYSSSSSAASISLAATIPADSRTARRSIAMRTSLSASTSSSITSRFTSPSVWNIWMRGTPHFGPSARATSADSQ
jgi:hypothetical protein